MCTALTLSTKDHYFGRNLDLDRSYGEEVCIMPRHFPWVYRQMGEKTSHYAMIGMATVVNGMPLFYEAANEYGLGIAGLNFPENADYAPIDTNKENIAPFELIPWLLGQCKNPDEVKEKLSVISIADIAFSDTLPLSPLHWMIAYKDQSMVLEARKDGLHLYDNPVGVMTNNPPFFYQLENYQKYTHLRTQNKDAAYEKNADYSAYCTGLGGVGLPGDVSSMSRFVRAAFARAHSVCAPDELSSVGQFFHLLSNVEMVRGICLTDEGTPDITGYTACINLDKGLYYYTTYDNRQISCVDLHRADLDGGSISRFPLLKTQNIAYQNA